MFPTLESRLSASGIPVMAEPPDPAKQLVAVNLTLIEFTTSGGRSTYAGSFNFLFRPPDRVIAFWPWARRTKGRERI
jgi:hypothetical protein